ATTRPATATPVSTWPTVAHSRSPARAEDRLAPASVSITVPVRIIVFIILPFIRTLMAFNQSDARILFLFKAGKWQPSQQFHEPTGFQQKVSAPEIAAFVQ